MTLACACATGSKSLNNGTVEPHELLEGAPLSRAQDELHLIESDEVLAVSGEMRQFLDSNVHYKASGQIKLRELIDAIINEGTFGLAFDGTTRTAAETFRLRRGNCLSFSNMFVAMARYVGLEAVYQEVDIPPDWAFQDDVFLLNRHVNVSVDVGRSGPHAVDFNIDDFKSSYDAPTISDTRALAHYYNNMGVEARRRPHGIGSRGLPPGSGGNDRRIPPAWTNLGKLYLRNDYPKYAEAAYLLALKADDEDLVAMSNLANFYERRGDVERAAIYRKQVVNHRKENPYYRYRRAREAYAAEDYDTAIIISRTQSASRRTRISSISCWHVLFAEGGRGGSSALAGPGRGGGRHRRPQTQVLEQARIAPVRNGVEPRQRQPLRISFSPASGNRSSSCRRNLGRIFSARSRSFGYGRSSRLNRASRSSSGRFELKRVIAAGSSWLCSHSARYLRSVTRRMPRLGSGGAAIGGFTRPVWSKSER